MSASSLPLWRKIEIVIGMARASARAGIRQQGFPILHSGVKIRVTRGMIRLGHLSEIHEGCVLSVAGTAEAPAVLSIGKRTSIWYNTVISARQRIEIGDDCAISWHCSILDGDMHQIIQAEEKRTPTPTPVRIEDHAWIGAGSIILKGVTIHTDSVVAAGSLVTTDVPPRTLVAGAPARVIRKIAGWR